ncbi:MAG: ribbon-helix-helix domain-containing protein [archaeon]
MANKSIHLRIPEELHERFEEIKDEHGYANIQEFIKEAVRSHLKNHTPKLKEVPEQEFDPFA